MDADGWCPAGETGFYYLLSGAAGDKEACCSYRGYI